MEEQRLIYLLERYQANAATAEELQELSTLLKVDAGSDLFKTVLAEMMGKEAPVFPMNQERWQKMALDIAHVDKGYIRPVVTLKTRVVRMSPWAGAAAVVLLMILGGYLWKNLKYSSSSLADRTISTARGEQREIILPDEQSVLIKDAPAADSQKAIEEIEKAHILSILEQCNFKISGKGGAAELLNLQPTALYAKIKKFGIKKFFY